MGNVISRKYVAILLATVALILPFSAQAATLSDSITQALSSHPDVAAGKAGAAAADKTLWEQQSGFFPVVGVRGSTGREHANNSTTRGLVGESGANSWVGQHGISVTQPIFSGFSVLNRVEAAEDRAEAAKLQLGTASEDLAIRAARAHLNLMRTRELLDLAKGYFSEIQTRRDKIAMMLNEGAVEEAELTQAEDVLLAAKSTRLGYEEAWKQAEADFIEVVGNKPDETLDFGTASWDSLIPEKLEDAIQTGLASSPAVLSADKMVSASGKERDAAKGDLMPRVDAEVAYDRKNQRDPMGGNSESATGLVRMSWNFSTGGAEVARIERGDDQKAEAMARRDKAARMTEHDIRQKFTSMEIVDEQFGLLVSRENAVKDILDSALKQFEAGKQSNLQIIAAHARLFDSRASRSDAYYRKLLSRFELLGAMGKLRAAFGIAPQETQKAAGDGEGLLHHVWGH